MSECGIPPPYPRIVFNEFVEEQVFEKDGSPGRIRTSDQPVNSRLLYR